MAEDGTGFRSAGYARRCSSCNAWTTTTMCGSCGVEDQAAAQLTQERARRQESAAARERLDFTSATVSGPPAAVRVGGSSSSWIRSPWGLFFSACGLVLLAALVMEATQPGGPPAKSAPHEWVCQAALRHRLSHPETVIYFGAEESGNGPWFVTGEYEATNIRGDRVRAMYECNVASNGITAEVYSVPL